MRVSGFTFIRNAVKFDFPAVEAISSILPVCDEMVVAVGRSEDNTLDLIRSIPSAKIRILETVWDESLIGRHGKVLAEETNKALHAISPDADWAFYIQCDEVIHEKYLPVIRSEMERWKEAGGVDGLLLDYLHFYGNYSYIGASPRWYRREIRVIRTKRGIYSYKDAQGFRKGENEKLRVKHIPACVYHYGYVRDPEKFAQKINLQHTYCENTGRKIEVFDYQEVDALTKFEGTHPEVMAGRILRQNWTFDYDISYNRYSLKDRVRLAVEKLTGYRMGEYRNYRITDRVRPIMEAKKD